MLLRWLNAAAFVAPAPSAATFFHGAAARADTGAPPVVMMWRGAKGIPKGKVPETTKADDKSWGLLEWFSDMAGGADEPDAGPNLGGGRRTAETGGARRNRSAKQVVRNERFDDAGNWKGDRRVAPKSAKKTVNDGAVKFNPFDASTW